MSNIVCFRNYMIVIDSVVVVNLLVLILFNKKILKFVYWMFIYGYLWCKRSK